MKLAKLLKTIPGLTIKGPRDRSIRGISSNSQAITPGDLFIAKKGMTTHGATYISQAIDGGACAVLTDLYDPSFSDVPQLIHPDVSAIQGMVASHYFEHPSARLLMVGVTGTNGKTTTAYLIQSFLERLRGPCGMLGTIEYVIGDKRLPAVRTTPDVVTNHKLLREMVQAGCSTAVMEVSSHALVQHRVDEIAFDLALFTNLTPDHLDYHSTMEEYCAAKNLLFRSLSSKHKAHFPKRAILNVDSPWNKKMAAGCAIPLLTYGIDHRADVQFHDLKLLPSQTEARISYQGASIPLAWPLIGRFNAYNMLGALAVVLGLGVPLEEAAGLAANVKPIPGRMEPVPNAKGLKVIVDFAHSEDALTNVFEALRELNGGRLITVFGCGGDRDPTKRVKMGEVCQRYADLSVITSDNPRSEDPQTIAEQIKQGFQRDDAYHVELDRREAIRYALTRATPRDIVLIAGKGHEPFQVFAHQSAEFDDRKVAAELLV